MLRLLKHEVSNYFANMGSVHIYTHVTNQRYLNLVVSLIHRLILLDKKTKSI